MVSKYHLSNFCRDLNGKSLCDMEEDTKTSEFIGVIAALGGALFSSSLTIGVSYLRSFSQNVLVFYGGICGWLIVLLINHFDTNSKIFHDFGDADLPKVTFSQKIVVLQKLKKQNNAR